MSRIDCNEIVKRMEERLSADYQIELHEASTVQLHNALAEAVMAVTAKDCRESRRAHERVRRAYYFSAEYLMGRSVFSNLYNLGILDEMRTLLRAQGGALSEVEVLSLEDIGFSEEIEENGDSFVANARIKASVPARPRWAYRLKATG